jgi:iron complex transport system substrate-binding protein
MKRGVLSLATVLLLGFGFVRSGDYGRGPAKAPSSSTRSQDELRVLRESAEGRVVRHRLGDTRVSRQARRIVSLSPAATDSLAALGIWPVLVESAWKSDKPAPYLADRLEGTAAIRRAGGLPLEAILDVNPDLILIGFSQDGKWYRQLSKIAPTVPLETTMGRSRETILLEVGDVVGLRPQAGRRLEAYHRRIEEAKAALAGSAGRRSVVFFRFRQHTCVVYARTTMFGPLLFERLGLRADPAMPRVMSPGGWDVFSLERLSTIRPDHIFMVVDTDSEAYCAYVRSTPIWQRLPAVKNGRVHRVAAATWLGGDGILANEAILKDVLAAMAPRRNP